MYRHRIAEDTGAWMSKGAILTLAAIDDPGARANLALKLTFRNPSATWDYLTQYVRPTDWNRGLSTDFVFIRRIGPGKDIGPTPAILGSISVPTMVGTDGRVLRLHRNRKGGLTIYATDTSGHFVYYYAHLDAYRRGLLTGAHLVRGQVIGYVGTTGNARRREPHLHFQVLVRSKDGRPWTGDAIDPWPLFARAGQASGKTTALASGTGPPG